jgi:hypothetical protein
LYVKGERRGEKALHNLANGWYNGSPGKNAVVKHYWFKK